MRLSATSQGLITALAVALACGLVAGLVTAFIHAQSGHEAGLFVHLKPIVVAAACYLAITLPVYYVYGKKYKFPGWALVSVIGSVLFVSIRLIPGIVSGWYAPAIIKPSLWAYISTEISAATNVVVFLILLTLPVAAGIAHLGMIFRPRNRS